VVFSGEFYCDWGWRGAWHLKRFRFAERRIPGPQPNGVGVLWNHLKGWMKTQEGEAPAEPPDAGPRCERLPVIPAAWRQPAGKGPASALASARTFGAKHSRGLPPNRSTAWRQPIGVEVLWNHLKGQGKTREGDAPAEPPNAAPRCERLRSSRDRRSPRGREAAQQELGPPGTCSCQKVKAIGP